MGGRLATELGKGSEERGDLPSKILLDTCIAIFVFFFVLVTSAYRLLYHLKILHSHRSVPKLVGRKGGQPVVGVFCDGNKSQNRTRCTKNMRIRKSSISKP